jgi:hypothetical protein
MVIMVAVDHPTRFRDTLACLCAFTESAVHVTCPTCQARAIVAPIDRPAGSSLSWPRRLVCTGCTYSRDQRLVVGGRRDHVDETSFGAPLWLQRPCRGHTLWALNAEHLDFLEYYIAADLRERGSMPGTLSMVESLPTWLKHAGHRRDVLRAIHHLRALLPATDPP